MPGRKNANYRYETDPKKIEQDSFKLIRKETNLNGLSREQQQVSMRVVHSIGQPDVAAQVRFSAKACSSGRRALANNNAILCDAEMVKQGVTKSLIDREPMCFLNDIRVRDIAEKTGETRSMVALSLWQHRLKGSVVIIGNAPTALFRLLEMLKSGCDQPALIIGTPVGFVGAAESKQALWDIHSSLGVECITVLGRQGGSAVASACCNALLRCNHGQWF
jgi:precorrin-8X/cobalt-precorrin-8 methylmutase